jgi:hypothetical protein
MKRITLTLALLGAATLLPGCVFAVGSTHEQQPKERLDRLERRIVTVEQQLGITPAPPPATAPAAEAQQ